MVTPHDEIDWKLMQAFVAVIDEGTLSGAARRLGATQPTLGRQIRQLEAQAGEVLFIRRGLRLEPTPHAMALMPQALEIDRSISDLSRKLRQAGDGAVRDKITVTAPTLIADEMLPVLLPEFRASLPQTAFEILPSDRLEDIHRRRVDFALRLVRPTQPDLIMRKLGRIAVGLYASQAYVDDSGRPSAPADLHRHRLILPANDTDLTRGIEGLDLNPKELKVVGLTDDLRTRLAMVRAGLGISTCHDWIAARDPGLQQVLPEMVLVRFDVWLVATDDLQRSRALRLGFDALADGVERLLVA